MAATVIANLSNFVFHVAMSRMLGAGAYGTLGAVLAIMLVLSVPVTAVQAAMTRHVAEQRDTRSVSIGPALRRSAGSGLATAAVVLGATPALIELLHLNGVAPVISLVVFVPAVFLGTAPRALLIAQERLRPVAVSIVMGTVVRLVVGVSLAAAGGGSSHALAAVALGEWVTAAVVVLAVRRHLSGRTGSVVRITWRESVQAMGALGGLWLLVGVDVVLARHYLPAELSGNYAAAATLGRGGLFLAAAMAIIALPRFSGPNPTVAGTTLRRTLALAGALAGLTATVLAMFPSFFVKTLYGSGYTHAAEVLPLIALIAVALGLATVLVYYHLGRRRPVALASWLGAAVASAIAMWSHGSLRAVAVSAGTGALVALLLLAAAAGRVAVRRPRPERRRARWAVSAPELDLSVVVPFYNPGPEFRSNLELLVEALQATETLFEVIPVSDGTTDGSEHTITGLDGSVAAPVILATNHGKGEALRVGLSRARGRYVGFIDADGDIDPHMWSSFLTIMRTYQPDVVIGSKRHPLSEVHYPPTRRIMSWGYQQIVRALFRLNVRDTQTGIKLARREVIARVLPRMLEKRFAFDLELLVVARRLGFRRVFEVPVRVDYQFRSTVSATAVWRTVLDTLAIFYRLRIIRYYDRPARSDGALWAPRPADEAAA